MKTSIISKINKFKDYLRFDKFRDDRLEIYKLIKDLPGDVLEFGVFKGNSLIRFLTFRSIIENNFSRKVYGFDTFKEFPSQKRKNDKKLKKDFTADAGKPIRKNILKSIRKKKQL